MNQIRPWEGAILSAEDTFISIAQQNKLVRWAEEAEFALDAMRRDENLRNCHPESIRSAIINVAAVGLSLNPAQKLAYLICHNGVAQLYVAYKGLVKIAVDSGAVEVVQAEMVYEDEEWEYQGPYTPPRHKFKRPNTSKPIGVYCHAITTKGRDLIEFMSWDEVIKVRDCAKTKKVWDKWPIEMAKKSVIKRAAKLWPEGNGRLNQAVDVINSIEGMTESEKAGAEPAMISARQANEIKAFLREHFSNPKVVQGKLLAAYGIRLVSHLPADKFSECMERLVLLRDRAAAQARVVANG